MKKPIIITVRGGMAYVDDLPPGISLEIHDYDITDVADEDVIDPNGKPYHLEIY